MTTPNRRDALAVGLAALAGGLAGCASAEGPTVPAGAGDPPGRDLVSPWLTLSGGWLLPDPLRVPAPVPLPRAPLPGALPAGRQQFIQPVGVAARADLVLVADAGARMLWRLDRVRDAIAPFAPFTGFTADHGVSIAVGDDLAVWVAAAADHEVLQYDARGRLVRRWRDEFDAQRPVAVAVPPQRDEVFVADGATAQVVLFNVFGRPVRVLDRGRATLQSIAAMVWGPRGLYVLDRLAQQVLVFGRGGELLEVIGENELVQPRALAVDTSGRVFVADDAEQRISVFRGPRLLARVGGRGVGPGRFGRIESLAVDGNLLYVADSINAQVQVLMVAPPSMEGQQP